MRRLAFPSRFVEKLIVTSQREPSLLVVGLLRVLTWRPPAPTTGLKVVKGAAKLEKLAAGANVTLLFTTSQPISVSVDIFRGDKNVLKDLRFSFKAGPVALGPFTVTEGGSYKFVLTAVDKQGRKATLSWTVTVPA